MGVNAFWGSILTSGSKDVQILRYIQNQRTALTATMNVLIWSESSINPLHIRNERFSCVMCEKQSA